MSGKDQTHWASRTAEGLATEQQKRCFDLLKKAYIDARDYAITKEELEYLASRVRKLQALTKRVCEEKIPGMVQ